MCSTRACVGSEDGGTPPDRCGPMSKSPHPRHLPLAYRVIVFFIRPLLMLTTKRAWRGGANLPTEGGFIACPNHLSHTDFLLFAHLMYDSGRPAFFLGKSELFKLPVLGWALAKAEQIPVYRGTQKATEAYRAAVAAVRSGKAVAMYPEGTITRDPDIWPMRGKTGAARVALETRCPVIPVTMWGPQAIMGPYERGFHLFPRKTIEVIVGAPVDLADLYDRPDHQRAAQEATDRIMAAITAQLETLRGEVAPAERFDPRKHGLPEFGAIPAQNRQGTAA